MTLSLPADAHETSNLTPVVSWVSVADSVGIDSYIVEVSRLISFETLALTDTVSGSRTQDTLSALSIYGTYYWRVRAIDRIKNIGPASDTRRFVVKTTSVVKLYEDAAYGDEVDTFLSRDAIYLEVRDSDENLDTAKPDTLTVTLYVGDHKSGEVVDTETFVLTETGDASAIFRLAAVSIVDTVAPRPNDGILSWGAGDTLHAAYVDENDSSDQVSDTALAIEIASSAALQLFENAAFTDDVDTYLTRDALYVLIQDTDENRNPQVKDTVSVTVTVGDDASGTLLDTETLVLTESTETSGTFLSGAIALTDQVVPAAGDGRLGWGSKDTIHVAYQDVSGTSESRSDTALAIEIPTTASIQFYENAVFTDGVDTVLARNDALYVEVLDTDENRDPTRKETVAVTVYVGNGSTAGGGIGILLDTESLVLTESGETTGAFRSSPIAVVDTQFPLISGDGRLAAGLGDTLHAAYQDPNTGSDAASDTALVVDSPVAGQIRLFRDTQFAAPADTFQVGDSIFVEVADADENRNPQAADTVRVVLTVASTGASGLDTQTLVLTETGETSGIFRSLGIALLETTALAAEDGILSVGPDSRILAVYQDPEGGADTKLVIVEAFRGNLRLTLSDTQPADLSIQERDTQAVARFDLSADEKESVGIRRIRVSHGGSMSASGVTAVALYRDAGTPGMLDAADTLFAAGTLSGGAADLQGDTIVLRTNDTVSILVVYQTAASLNDGDTFHVQIQSVSDLTATGGISNRTPDISGLPLTSRTVTVRSRYPAVTSVHPPNGAYVLPPPFDTALLPIRIVFNVPIDSGSADETGVRIVDENGTSRTKSVRLPDSRTIEIVAIYADTEWPAGKSFQIRVSTSIKDRDAPPDSLQAEFVSVFQILQTSQGELVTASQDGKATMKIDSGDIVPEVKSVWPQVFVPDDTNPVLQTARNVLSAHPQYQPIPAGLGKSMYDFSLKKLNPADSASLIALGQTDFLNPVDVAISIIKPTEFLEAKGAVLNASMLRMAHFKEDAGVWEILTAQLDDYGSTVTIRAPTTSFSVFAVVFAFASGTVTESFRSFPNPANPAVTYTGTSGSWQGFQFAWNMPKAGAVTIRIYDFAGQLVREIGPTAYAAGNLFGDAATLTKRTWDGKNGRGQTVLNGVYFVRAVIEYTDGSSEVAADRIMVVK